MKTAIAIDIGGTHIKYAAVTENGSIIWDGKRPTEAQNGKEDLLNRLARCIMEAGEHVQGEESPSCVGIGTSGLVDIEKGLVMGGAPNLPEWENLPLADILREKTGLPVFVDNDANLMGLGEYRFGFNESGQNLIFLTIGTGIGGAIIINGELYRGHNYSGAELGCFPMYYKDKRAYWEDFASTAVMVANYEEKYTGSNVDRVNGKFITEAYLRGESLAIEVMEEHFELVALGVAGLINIFNPEKVVIGGGISEAGSFYLENIIRKTEELVMTDCYRGVKISSAKLGNKAGFLGAAHFALGRFERGF